MDIKIKRATYDGIKTCEGQLYELDGFQYCIGRVDGEMSAIELSTGFRSARVPIGFFKGENRTDLDYIDEVVKMVKQRSPLMKDKIKEVLEVMEKDNIPYPLNERIINPKKSP